jgi:hypothetical protein
MPALRRMGDGHEAACHFAETLPPAADMAETARAAMQAALNRAAAGGPSA